MVELDLKLGQMEVQLEPTVFHFYFICLVVLSLACRLALLRSGVLIQVVEVILLVFKVVRANLGQQIFCNAFQCPDVPVSVVLQLHETLLNSEPAFFLLLGVIAREKVGEARPTALELLLAGLVFLLDLHLAEEEVRDDQAHAHEGFRWQRRLDDL